MRRSLFLPILLAAAALSACDLLGPSAEQLATSKEAEGKAVGAACRHAGRAIEDCYAMNKKADKAAVFAGWRDMNDYMRENQIETVPASGVVAKAAEAEPADSRTAEQKPAEQKAADAKPGDLRIDRAAAIKPVVDPIPDVATRPTARPKTLD